MTNKEAIKFLKIEVNRWEYDCKSLQPMKEAITLAIKALENEPKKGEWIVDDEDEIYMWCNQCEQGKRYSQSLYIKKTNFCPNCGADMRGDENGS